jgi:hypothetical protein
MIERPIAPMMVIRVQTDWYVHDTEFRYVLQPGETISASHSLPIGQVFFVPREEVTLRDGTQAEVAARLQASETFYNEKSASKVKTPYGLEYSPHYHRTSRLQNAAPVPASGATPPAPPEPPSVAAMDPLPDPSRKIGRNDPCPCGSGRKYKKCHAEVAG